MICFPAFEVPAGLDTPALCIDAERMHANIARMAEAVTARGVALRPHAKTHKSPQVARAQLRGGAIGITTSTVGEAEVFADAGVDDIFVAYPVWADPRRGRRIGQLAERVSLAVGVESVESAAQLARTAPAGLRVLVEVDSGEHRTGVSGPAAAVEVADAAAAAGLDVVGVFTHGGHSYASPAATGRAADDEVAALSVAADALRTAGHDARIISAGSTPTAVGSAREPVTEERPGTFVFGDRQQVALGAHPAESVALFVAATVVSTTIAGQFVLDAGAKILTKDRPATVTGFGAIGAYPHGVIHRIYDHHAVVDTNGGPRPRPGDKLALIPNHACPVVNTSDCLNVVSNGDVVDRWPVAARGRNT